MIQLINCNNTYHCTIKLKVIDVKLRTHSDFNKENNEKDPKFKISDYVRISKYKNIIAHSKLVCRGFCD